MALISTLVVLSSTGQSPAADSRLGRTLLREDFNQGSEGQLAKRLLSNRHIAWAKGAGPDGSDAIRVAYVGFEQGSERVVVPYPLAWPVDRATLSFDVRFDKDFQWTCGGKLHGLGPKNPITGGAKRRPEGWSARIMFRQDGRCDTYLYDQDQTKKWGIGNTTHAHAFKAGQWHHVTLQVSLNDPGQANGSARILIDGREAVTTENVEFRGRGGDDTRIQQFLFSTFHGGHDPKWTPVDSQGKPTTVYATFDNVTIVEGIQPEKAGARGGCAADLPCSREE